jgi:hypothetical protein
LTSVQKNYDFVCLKDKSEENKQLFMISAKVVEFPEINFANFAQDFFKGAFLNNFLKIKL